MSELRPKSPAEMALDRLAEMLEQYRFKERELPTYEELAALVSAK
jgi:hypothetical protein